MFRHPAARFRPRPLDTGFFRQIVMAVLFGLIGLYACADASTASAQNGAFLESLFRSIAEQQIDDTRRRSERPQPSRQPPPSRPRDVHPFEVTLSQFDADLAALMPLVQSAARTNREYRTQLPRLYRLQADVRALAGLAERSSSLQPLVPAFQAIDQHYRELSFQLREIPDRDRAVRNQIARCDSTSRTLTNLIGIAPQFDRQALHNQMVIAATYIQALMDDLPSARMPTERSRALVHDARLLRQTILEESDQVGTASYEEIVTRFTDFVARWRSFAEAVAAARDPMLDRRLARVTQCGDETYAILWMAPPPNRLPPSGLPTTYPEQWIADAAALEGIADYFHADLVRLKNYLRPAGYARSVIDHAAELHEIAETIHNQLDAGEPFDRLQRSASRLADVWQSMADEIDLIGQRGLTSRRAQAVAQQQQQMLPLVASLTAAMLQEPQ